MLTDIIEALIFASGRGISSRELYEGLKDKYTMIEIEKAIRELKESYSGPRGIILIEFNDTYQFQTNPEYGELLADLLQKTKERELSKTLLQVLAIIAYKSPITKQEIEELRGVNSDYVVQMLLKLNLIEPVGRKETLGQPILYATTEEFLKKFGLTSLAELPDYEDLLQRIKNNFDKYYEKSEDLYRHRSISENGDSDAAAVEAAAAVLDSDAGDDDELPDFLLGEDVVEVE
ncbi:MAG: SMC-Scp complex subunit ScpB [Clostridiales bacterium]|jgi:segregation and condensation protein B|nr:SMC-Scp complex subunit ScpB [Clostridiales bacterium]HOB64508.1 SMC-Scp complex subunit ScpB [Clostridia bacterium]HOK81460.1 SMC-Scp complex subunit ScpB [Clostridia bacterium]HOL60760.1 SMC-Scp complex subunit ScpB [Clostridia bacterium]HPO53335.1 SMC-Scp complex subunit ScpB [Clostridia bacterium]